MRIKFIGKVRKINKKTGRLKYQTLAPPDRVINGGKTVELPDAKKQLGGFTHTDAEFLASNYPHLYKKIK